MSKQVKRKVLIVSDSAFLLVKNACPAGTKLHQSFSDTITRLGVAEYKRIKKFGSNVSRLGTVE